MAADLGKYHSRTFFSALLAISVLGLFLFYRDDVLNAFVGIRRAWVGLGLICFLTNYAFRAARIHVLTQKRFQKGERQIRDADPGSDIFLVHIRLDLNVLAGTLL